MIRWVADSRRHTIAFTERLARISPVDRLALRGSPPLGFFSRATPPPPFCTRPLFWWVHPKRFWAYSMLFVFVSV